MDPQQAIALLGSQPHGVNPTYLRMISNMMRSPINAPAMQPPVGPSMTVPQQRPNSLPGTQLQNQPTYPQQ